MRATTKVPSLRKTMTTAIVPPSDYSSRLDPHETYDEVSWHHIPRFDPRIESSYHNFRHGSWKPQRDRTLRALSKAFISQPSQRRFADCGSGAKVFRHNDDKDKYQIRSHKCRSRWCLPCARERGRNVAASLADVVGNKTVRFITLTLKTTSEPLAESVAHLTKSFTRLRSSPLWKQTQSGGAAFMEVKWSKDRQRWHPHLHIITEGKWIKKADLSSAWLRATGTSFIVDVGLVKSREHLCRYVTSYTTKPIDVSVTKDEDRFVEAIKALHGKRACATFGTWRGLKLIHKPENDDWTFVGHYGEMYSDAETCPTGKSAAIIRALTKARKPDEWKKESRGPPEDGQEETWYDYSAE